MTHRIGANKLPGLVARSIRSRSSRTRRAKLKTVNPIMGITSPNLFESQSSNSNNPTQVQISPAPDSALAGIILELPKVAFEINLKNNAINDNKRKNTENKDKQTSKISRDSF